MILISRIDAALMRWFAPWAYIAGVIVLGLTFLGPEVRGAHRWIFFGTWQIQPSELLKPFFLLGFAWFMSQFSPRRLKYLPLHLGLFLVPAILVFRQPDLGTSLIYSGFWLSMIFAAGLPIWIITLGLGGIALISPALWHLLADFQKSRILTFLHPTLDPRGAGYNALQSMIAVGSGQLFGRGLGRGTQSHLRFLPEFHTDFIFATLVEELGFFGGLTLLTGYGLLLMRLLLPIFRAETQDKFSFIITFGVFGLILGQTFINAGMNMGILPITGITLPFVSYGGSSMLALFAAFGCMWSLRRH